MTTCVASGRFAELKSSCWVATPISDDGLVDLASLPGLRSVDLSATHVTPEGLAEFSRRTTAAVTSQSRKEMTERVSDWFRQNRVELVPDTGEPRRLILRSTPWYEMELVPLFQTLTDVRVEGSFFNLTTTNLFT